MIHFPPAVPHHEKRQAMGPADEGAGIVEEAAVPRQEGTGAVVADGAGALPDSLAFDGGDFKEGLSQGGGLHGEEREVPAAAVTPCAAGDLRTEPPDDPAAEVVYAGNELPIVGEPGVQGVCGHSSGSLRCCPAYRT